MKRLIPLLFLLSALSWSQSTTVTLQVTDVGGQTWNNGSWSVQLVSQPGASNQGPPFLIKGTATPVANQTLSGTLSSTGGASLSLVPNASISPAQSTWRFVVCPNATIDCYRQSVIIAGASQNVNLTPPTIQISGQNGLPPNVIAYTDSEIVSPAQGAQYFNTISLAQRQWTGSAWVTIGNSANVSCGTIGAIVRQSAIGPIFVCDPNATLDGNGLLGVTGINVNGAGNGTIDFLGGTAPTNPSASHCKLYYDTGTGFLSAVNSSGASCLPSGGGGSTAWASLTFPSTLNLATFGTGKAVELTDTPAHVFEFWMERSWPSFFGAGWELDAFDPSGKGVKLDAYEDSTTCQGVTLDGGGFVVASPLGSCILGIGSTAGVKTVAFPDGSTWDAFGDVKAGPSNINIFASSPGASVHLNTNCTTCTAGIEGATGGQFETQNVGTGNDFGISQGANGNISFRFSRNTDTSPTGQFIKMTNAALGQLGAWNIDGSIDTITQATGDNGTKAATTAFVQDKGGTGSVNNFAQYDASNRLTDSSKAKPSGAVVGTTDTQTLTNKVLADKTNNTSFLNIQGPGAPITGNAADQALFTYTVPGNTLTASGLGSCIRATVWILHSTGSANVTYKWKFGGTSEITATSTGVGNSWWGVVICNNAATNAQTIDGIVGGGGGSIFGSSNHATDTKDTTTNQNLEFYFNVAATDAVTPQRYLVEILK